MLKLKAYPLASLVTTLVEVTPAEVEKKVSLYPKSEATIIIGEEISISAFSEVLLAAVATTSLISAQG